MTYGIFIHNLEDLNLLYRDRIEEARMTGVDFNDRKTWSHLYKKGKAAFQARVKDFTGCATQ